MPNSTSYHLSGYVRQIPLSECYSCPQQERFDELRRDYPGSKLLIVSNTAGTASVAEAEDLERKTGVKVLPHSTKKPGCHPDIMAYFRNNKDSGVSSPQHVAIVGDRLFTDVMMANMMGSYAIWVRDGVVKDEGMFARFEKHLATFLWKRGYHPPMHRERFSG
ncbi:hypothetical protein M8818_000576 [Zalaria obscura]|uniref:Uncharacterized protein n=1 Tax=Zalaria obscura TaxID=2024903 RepID=A0ACC3SPW1_9PEZI